jgi:rare lipoprotein A (peptidoglycan hydrolase)
VVRPSANAGKAASKVLPALAVSAALLLGACSSLPKLGSLVSKDKERVQRVEPVHPAPITRGPDLAEPVPRNEPLIAAANEVYFAHGRTHFPLADDSPFQEVGEVSVVDERFNGRATASGEPHDVNKLTAGHPTLPIPSYIRVINRKTGVSSVVRVNDRGPSRRDRVLDLSQAAAARIGVRSGDDIELIRITAADIAKMEGARRVAAAPPQASQEPPAAAIAAPVPPPAQAAPIPAPAPVPRTFEPRVPSVAEQRPEPARGPRDPNPAPPAGMARLEAAPRQAAPVPSAPIVASAPARMAPSEPIRPTVARASSSSRPGRYSVQVGVFAVPGMADNARQRVEEQLSRGGRSLAPEGRVVSVVRKSDRSYVLVGDLDDSASAESLAQQVRSLLRRDVVVFRH